MAGEYAGIRSKIVEWANESERGLSESISFSEIRRPSVAAETKAIGDTVGYVSLIGKTKNTDSRDTEEHRYDFVIGFIERLASGVDRDERIDQLTVLHEEIDEQIFDRANNWNARMANVGDADAEIVLAPAQPLSYAPFNDDLLMTSGVFDSAIPIGFWVYK